MAYIVRHACPSHDSLRQPMRFDSCPIMSAATIGGVPQAVATARKAVYMAPMCAAPEAKK